MIPITTYRDHQGWGTLPNGSFVFLACLIGLFLLTGSTVVVVSLLAGLDIVVEVELVVVVLSRTDDSFASGGTEAGSRLIQASAKSLLWP